MQQRVPLNASISILLFACGSVLAQTAGNLTGQIFDATQGAIPGATVTAENTGSGQRRQATTDNSGRYTIATLPVGVYRVTAEQKGFQPKVMPSVAVGVAQAVTLDITLATGTLNEVVEVKGQGSILDAGDTTGSTFQKRSLVELPINGRDYARFSLLTPGAVASSNFIAMLTFNGQQSIQNQFQIDGVDATRVDQPYMANGFERGSRLLTGSLETIEEFRAQTSTYPAEYGRASGTYVNIATKSGGNAMHGSLFEFLRNNALDARNFFNAKPAPQAAFRYNDFGGNLGGPIRKDKTFYFVNYEGSRQRVGITGSGSVPSALLRSQVLAKSPVLSPILDLFPAGTGATANPLIDSYTTTAVSQIREDTGSVKMDHNFSPSNSAYVRVNVNDSHVFGPLFGVTPAALGLQDFQNVPIRTSNIALHDQHVFTPRLVNEFLAGMQRWGSKIISDEPFPLISITGLVVSPGTRGRSKSNNTSFQLSDSLSYTAGAHRFKAGFQAYRIQLDRKSINTTSISYTSIADFINNSAFSASQSIGNPGTATRGYQAAFFVQDSWQIRNGLTLDYGMRFDFDPPPFDPGNAQQPFSLALGKLAPGGTNIFKTNKNISPRLGIAWQAAKKLMIRSGYGVFYQAYPVGFGASIATNNLPGNTSLLRSQIAALSYPITPFLTQGSLALPSVTGYDPNRNDPYSHQWNLTAEYAITNDLSLSTAYVGDHSLNLRRNENLNFINPATGTRPIAGFSNVNIEMNNGQGNYHSLQVKLNQRYSRHLSGGVSYTLGHTIDDVQDYGIFSTQPQDNNNLRAEKGNSSNDIRHNVSYQLVYELPFGKGRKYLNHASGAVGAVVSGWQISGVGTIRSGIATSVLMGVNTFGNGNLTNQRPNAVAGVSVYAADKTINHWLNPAAFSLPAAGTFGNLGRNVFYGPGYAQEDLMLGKVTRIREKATVQFRAEVFNIFNHPNFDVPSATFNTSTFGQVLNTFGRTFGGGVSRQIQLALKFGF